jgi:hypothetical protein
MRLIAAKTLATALTFGAVANASVPPQAPERPLPTYTYAIHSGQFVEAGLLLSSVHVRIPSTVWLCTIVYYGSFSLLAKCSAPSIISGNDLEVITKVSCTRNDSDSETINLSTLIPGAYASLSIACKRDISDDGF